MAMKRRFFRINDIDSVIVVEESPRKEVLSWIDEHIENVKDDFDMSDFAVQILYEDGSTESICGNDYDGHKIRRQHIVSAVYSNPCSDIVFGNYEINHYGVVTVDFNKIIDDNITEVTEGEAR